MPAGLKLDKKSLWPSQLPRLIHAMFNLQSCLIQHHYESKVLQLHSSKFHRLFDIGIIYFKFKVMKKKHYYKMLVNPTIYFGQISTKWGLIKFLKNKNKRKNI